MSTRVKRSELAEQIELARRSIERWPGWLREAAGIPRSDTADPKLDRQSLDSDKAPADSDD